MKKILLILSLLLATQSFAGSAALKKNITFKKVGHSSVKVDLINAYDYIRALVVVKIVRPHRTIEYTSTRINYRGRITSVTVRGLGPNDKVKVLVRSSYYGTIYGQDTSKKLKNMGKRKKPKKKARLGKAEVVAKIKTPLCGPKARLIMNRKYDYTHGQYKYYINAAGMSRCDQIFIPGSTRNYKLRGNNTFTIKKAIAQKIYNNRYSCPTGLAVTLFQKGYYGYQKTYPLYNENSCYPAEYNELILFTETMGIIFDIFSNL